MTRIKISDQKFSNELIEWLIDNIGPLLNSDDRTTGHNWRLYWVYETGDLWRSTEVAFVNDDDATLFKLRWL